MSRAIHTLVCIVFAGNVIVSCEFFKLQATEIKTVTSQSLQALPCNFIVYILLILNLGLFLLALHVESYILYLNDE